MLVSGVIILDYVRLIRSDKSKNWERWLAPEDWAVINGKIDAAGWYPYALFRRLGWAAYKEVAEGDPSLTEQFGRFCMQGVLQVHPELLVSGHPVDSVIKAADMWSDLFQGSKVTSAVTQHGDNWVTYRFQAPEEENDLGSIAAYAYQMSGQLVELVVKSGATKVRAEVSPEDHSQLITIRWESGCL
jgi:hypothetical protein